MNNFLTIAVALTLLSCGSKNQPGDHAHHTDSIPQPQSDTLKKSIPREAHAMVGDTHLTITYHAPAVRGRLIWGGLVPFGEVWVTGAHRATTFEVTKDITVGNQHVAAGKYGLFTIPGKNEWVFILNKNWDQHLTDEYAEAEDVLRMTVAPEMTEDHQERLEYNIQSVSDQEAMLEIRWEKIALHVPLKTGD